jgi:hypothetical protein
MARPRRLNGFGRVDSASTWITRRAKPVVGWRACRAAASAEVRGAVDRAPHDGPDEVHVVRDDGASEVLLHPLERPEHELLRLVVVLGDNLAITREIIGKRQRSACASNEGVGCSRVGGEVVNKQTDSAVLGDNLMASEHEWDARQLHRAAVDSKGVAGVGDGDLCSCVDVVNWQRRG